MSGALEEYKELRSELRLMLDRREKVRSFAYTVALGVLGLGFSDHVAEVYRPVFLVAGAFCVLALWYDEIRRMKAIYRIAAYIEIFTEQSIPDMHWETWGGLKNRQPSLPERILANADLAILGTMLAISGVWTLSSRYPIGAVAAACLLALQAVVTGVQGIALFRVGRSREKERWERIRADFREQLG